MISSQILETDKEKVFIPNSNIQTWKIGDCLKLLPDIPDKSINFIITDLPYGSTRNRWDQIIPLEKLWFEYERIISNNGAIALTSQTPFDKVLGCSNLKLLKYEWIWQKTNSTGFLNAYRMPLKSHENILIFYKHQPTYNPQMTLGKPYRYEKDSVCSDNYAPEFSKTGLKVNYGTRMPISVQVFKKDVGIHPTQKPLELFKYLIKTYTNEGDIVHDSCMGSGTSLESCIALKRNFIGFEILDTWENNYRKMLSEKKNMWKLSKMFKRKLS